ncbi:MAG: hypothetical protein L3K07_01235 [Thermoplasmata archaeon]|nr:hypothetical protein [Thermoplasmata archaeon]
MEPARVVAGLMGAAIVIGAIAGSLRGHWSLMGFAILAFAGGVALLCALLFSRVGWRLHPSF